MEDVLTEPDTGAESEEESPKTSTKRKKTVRFAKNGPEPRVKYVLKSKLSPQGDHMNLRKGRKGRSSTDQLQVKRCKGAPEPKGRGRDSMRDLKLQWPATTADLLENKSTAVKPLKRCPYCLFAHFESWRLRLHMEREHAAEIQSEGTVTAWKKTLNLSRDGGRIIDAVRVKNAMISAKLLHFLVDGMMPIVKRAFAEALTDIGDEAQRPGTRHQHWKALYNDLPSDVSSSTMHHDEGSSLDEDQSETDE